MLMNDHLMYVYIVCFVLPYVCIIFFCLQSINRLSLNFCFIVIFLSDTYPMLLVANKVDLVHLRKVTEEQGRDLAEKLKVNQSISKQYLNMCGKTGMVNLLMHKLKKFTSIFINILTYQMFDKKILQHRLVRVY